MGQAEKIPLAEMAETLKVIPGEGISAPAIPLQPGEHYRFHFDMNKCIGCKCCEVACHEQNNNPAEVKWRRVGEVEGGVYPDTKHFFTSMSCNHCAEPSCMIGCPVDAYRKDPLTGVVLLDTNQCIGCQYCTWNCPYGAPQFNPERNVVTKCDLCHNRLADGELPACVSACPSGALEIEAFDPIAWKADLSGANAPGMPDAGLTGSTTRITLPANLDDDAHRIDDFRLKPEHPHYSLIFLTVLTQVAVGGSTALFALECAAHFLSLPAFLDEVVRIGALATLGVAGLALSGSVFHLGRPAYAWRAIKMWRRSWLSREVLLFSIFAGFAGLYAGSTLQSLIAVPFAARAGLGAAAVLSGLAGVYASARIYCVPARPSWNTFRTPLSFFATSFILGPLVALLVFLWNLSLQDVPFDQATPTLQRIGVLLIGVLVLAGFTQLGGIFVKLLHSINGEQPELRASAQLLTQRFRSLFMARLGVLLLSLLLVPLSVLSWRTGALQSMAIAVSVLAALMLASEFVGRYLFFVTVVPKNRPEGYA